METTGGGEARIEGVPLGGALRPDERALATTNVFTRDEVKEAGYNTAYPQGTFDGPGLGATCMLRNFRHWRYRPVHSFLDTVRNDWQDRGVADSVVAEIESFRIWGPALWDAGESATDEIDVPRDYVPAATA